MALKLNNIFFIYSYLQNTDYEGFLDVIQKQLRDIRNYNIIFYSFKYSRYQRIQQQYTCYYFEDFFICIKNITNYLKQQNINDNNMIILDDVQYVDSLYNIQNILHFIYQNHDYYILFYEFLFFNCQIQ